MRWATLAALTLAACLSAEEGTELFEAEEGSSTPVYGYRTPDGRWAFTDDPERLGPELRDAAAPVDLSDVSLNTELGSAIAARAAEEHERLASAPGCAEARREAERDTLSQLLSRHRATVGIAIVALLFVVAAPKLVRYFGAPEWSRVLSIVLPILGCLAALTFGVIEARRSLDEARRGAALCDPESFATAPMRERLDRLDRLEAFLEAEGPVMITD